MKKILFLLFVAAITMTACSEEQMDAAVNDGVAGTIVADEKEEKGNLDIDRVTPPRWKDVAGFKGKKNQKTRTFKITGEEWKVEWDVKGGEEDEFIIIMKNRHDKEDSEIIANQIGSGKDFVDFEGGRGEYYLDISSKVPYSIKVEQFK